jgi:hypothetical protein
VRALEKALYDLELLEEGLVMKAHSDGIEVLRRIDMNPAVVLGVVPRKKEVAA